MAPLPASVRAEQSSMVHHCGGLKCLRRWSLVLQSINHPGLTETAETKEPLLG